MGIFGEYGSRDGTEIEERQKLLASISTEKDPIRLAKFIAFDQVDSWYDPCGKGGLELNQHMTDMTKKSIRRLYQLFVGEENRID